MAQKSYSNQRREKEATRHQRQEAKRQRREARRKRKRVEEREPILSKPPEPVKIDEA